MGDGAEKPFVMNQNRHRILLIEPPFYRLYKDTYSLNLYPLSLGYLSCTIKKETNWEVMVYNADFNPNAESIKVAYLTGTGLNNYLNDLKDLSRPIWRKIKSTISEYKPTVVGISAKSQNFASVCNIARFTKEINKQIIIIVGGPHPSMVGADVLNCLDIDICVKGEGEKTIVELLNAIDAQKELDGVKGIIYRKNNQIFENAPREFIKDLDSLCFPYENVAEVLKDYSTYPITAFKNIFATRGCPNNCFFCGSREIWSRKVRVRSPENVVKEIKCLQAKGLYSVNFNDDIFGINKQYIKNLCNALIIHCPGLKWSCEFHVKLVDEETISLMKAAGCFSIALGIESGNNEILESMRKNFTVEEAVSACKIIKKSGIELHAFFMVGFPQETENTLNDTVATIKKIKSETIVYSIFTPYPGTEAFEFCKEKGLIGDRYDVSLYNHQSPANCFCVNLTPEKFRSLIAKLEKTRDRKILLNNIKRIFSLNILWRIRELGLGKSFKKGIKVLFGK